jgi:hypothetical protein
VTEIGRHAHRQRRGRRKVEGLLQFDDGREIVRATLDG